MEQNVLTAKSSRIYDPHFGFYVKKLEQDTSIPILQKINGATWSPVYTAPGQEERLVHLLRQKQITTYYPAILNKDKTAKKIPFFPGVVFAALSPEKRAMVENQLLVAKVTDINNHDMEELVFADMVFMNMAERICRFYPFSYEKRLPDMRKSRDQIMPMTIDGYGDCCIISNAKREDTQMFFHFKTVEKILKFDLSLYQFRSLLLSKILFQ